MATWTIKGEASKAWDATTKTFEERKIEDGRFEFRSLDADTFQFTISAKDIASETLPDYVQQVTIYRDGTQFFVGHVTNRTVSVTAGQQVCTVTVSGAWWWMDRIPFTATNTDGTGATAERLTLAFGTASSGQDLKTSIETAINRSVDLGVPIAKTTAGTPSTVATMTTFPRITLNQSTCGQVISELVRCCADAMVYFDYTTATPTMHVTRRKSGLAVGSASATTIDATGGTVTSVDLNPMIELQVSRVELPYVTRDVQGRTQFATQTFGTAASPLPKRQVLTVSGPELDTFLPNDLFDSYQIKTAAATGSTSQNDAFRFAHDQDGTLVSIAKNNGLSRLPMTLSPGGVYSLTNTRSTFGASTFRRGIVVPSLQSKSGATLSTSTYKLVTTDNLPDWVKEDPAINVVEAIFTGCLMFQHVYETGKGATYVSLPPWYSEISWDIELSGYEGPGDSADFIQYAWKFFQIDCLVTSTTYSTLTTIYRPADYSFISPPAGLAQFLKEAQDYVPYEGAVQIVEQDVGATRYRGTKVSVTNSLTEYSSMSALVAGESLDIKSGTTQVALGQAPRLDYRTLVDRIRKTSQDNIVYV